MRQMNIKVAPGEVLQIGAVGDYVRVKDAAIAVRIESPDRGEFLQMEAGDAVILSRFNRLNISHDDVAEQDVSLLIGDGTRSESSTVHRLIGSIAVDAAGPMVFGSATVQANTATMILPANTSRRFLLVRNHTATTAADVLFLNFSAAVGVAWNQGYRFEAGGILVFDTYCPSDEIWVKAGGIRQVTWLEG